MTPSPSERGEQIPLPEVQEDDRLRVIYSPIRYDSDDQDRVGSVGDTDQYESGRTKSFDFETQGTEGGVDVVLTFDSGGMVTTSDGRTLGTWKRIYRLDPENA